MDGALGESREPARDNSGDFLFYDFLVPETKRKQAMGTCSWNDNLFPYTSAAELHNE